MSTPIGMSAAPSALRIVAISRAAPREEAGVRGHGAAQPDHPGMDVLRPQPRAVQAMVLGGRAEVPDVRIAAAGQERVAGHLVARPLADVGARDVADVVEVEEQDGAEVGRLERGPGARRAGTSAAARRSSAPPSRRSSSRARRTRWSSAASPVLRSGGDRGSRASFTDASRAGVPSLRLSVRWTAHFGRRHERCSAGQRPMWLDIAATDFARFGRRNEPR